MAAAGFVYFVQAGDRHGPIKIGTATNITKRVSSLQSGNAEELRVLTFFAASTSIEAVLHGRFSEGRIRGEWFDAYTPGLAEFMRAVRRSEFPAWVLPYLPTEAAAA